MIKLGYKHTELGWIPEEWEIKKLKSVVNINSRSLTEKTESSFSFYYIDLSSVNNGKISYPQFQISFQEAPSRARRVIRKNNILMATVRPNLLGFAYFEKDEENYIASTGFAILESKSNSFIKYVYQLLFSNLIINQINNLVVGSNYPAINNDDVGNLIIPLPPLLEQKKIAEILSTWDKAIETTEKLIEAKTKLKKGLMQKLFSTDEWDKRGIEWKEVRLNSLGCTYNGLTGKSAEHFGSGRPYIPYLNIFNNYKIDISHFGFRI